MDKELVEAAAPQQAVARALESSGVAQGNPTGLEGTGFSRKKLMTNSQTAALTQAQAVLRGLTFKDSQITAALEAIQSALDEADAEEHSGMDGAARERERLVKELRTMHTQQQGRHNYYLYAAELLAGKL